jgi:hypothetical protein
MIEKKKPVMERASWIKPLSTAAKIVGNTSGISSTETGITKKKYKAAEAKPNLKLQAAAQMCSYKMESWAVSQSSGLKTSTSATDKNSAKNDKFSLAKHNKHFDPFTHGYTWGKDGRLWYVRGDGVRVLAESGVNQLTEEGLLIPLC